MLEPGGTPGQDVSKEMPAVAQLSDDQRGGDGVQRGPPSSQAEDPPEVDTPSPTPTNKVLL